MYINATWPRFHEPEAPLTMYKVITMCSVIQLYPPHMKVNFFI